MKKSANMNHFVSVICTLSLIAILLTACKRTEYITLREVQRDTIHRLALHLDTFRIRDSIYITERQRGDTILQTHYVERWRERTTIQRDTVHHTTYIQRPDTACARALASTQKKLTATEQKYKRTLRAYATLLSIAILYLIYICTRKRR